MRRATALRCVKVHCEVLKWHNISFFSVICSLIFRANRFRVSKCVERRCTAASGTGTPGCIEDQMVEGEERRRRMCSKLPSQSILSLARDAN